MKKAFFLLSFFLGFGILAIAQENRLATGKVVDSAGGPLEDANVVVKGKSAGSKTNAKGEFTIKLPAGTGNVTLVVSFTGYLKKDVSTDGKKPITVELTRSSEELATVSVVQMGYYSVKTKDKTGSISSIGSKDLKDNTINNAAEAITGKLAGVQVTTSEGSPDAEININIRGGGSLTQSNKPLTVVDGVIVEDGLSAISPQDIESIDVLKDASSTAVYGARGANGVIVVTTKSGKSGRTSITYSGFAGFKELSNHLDVMDPYNFVEYQYERYISTGGSTTEPTSFPYGSTFDSLAIKYKNITPIDWQEEVFGRKAFMQSHNVSVSGGTKNTTYNLSLTSNGEQGVLMGTDFDRKLVSFKFDHKFDDKLKVGLNTRYNQQVVTGPKVSEGDESQSSNKLRHSVRYRPFMQANQPIDFLDPDITEEGGSSALINPIVVNNEEYRKIPKTYINVTGYASYKITKQWSFKTTLGVDNRYQQEKNFYGNFSNKALFDAGYQFDSSKPILRLEDFRRTSFNNSNVLSYSNSSSKSKFKEKNTLDILIGEETYQLTEKTNVISRGGFPTYFTPDQAFNQLNMGIPYINGKEEKSNSLVEEKRLLSFFTRVGYDYMKKYFVALTFRGDGSSIFAPGKRWGYFPSASLAWRVANEKFMEKITDKTPLSDLKLRVSYGLSGNNNVVPYYYLDQYVYNYDLNALVEDHLPNPDLKWETTYSGNLGVDLGFFRDRLTLSVDLYKNITKDLLTQQPVNTSIGGGLQYQNIGQTSNKGVEIQLAGLAVSKKKFTWNISFNIAFNQRRLDKFNSGGANFRDYSSGWGGNNIPFDYRVQEGKPIGQMYGYVTDGFYKASDFNWAGTYTANDLKDDKNPNTPKNNIIPALPGTIKFKDLNGDGVVDEKDKTVIGQASPKYTGGLTQQFTIGNFDANIFVNWVVGNDVYNANLLDFTSGQTKNANMLKIMEGRWRITDNVGNDIRNLEPASYDEINKNATIWQPSQLSGPSTTFHSAAVEDGSFLRINNISLGYTVKAKWLSRIKVSKLRIYATGTNLAVITNYTGYDPEVNTRTKTPLTPSVDYSAYPRSRSYVFGLNIGL